MRLILVLLLLPSAVMADTLLCLGTRPGWMMTIEDDTVAFDYLGDGRYTLDPGLAGRADGFSSHDLITARERWPVFLENRACRVVRATLPISIEVAVPSSAGRLPLRGCCKWQDRSDPQSGS